MVIYIKKLWVIESESLEIKKEKEFVTYDPSNEEVLFQSDILNECIEYAKEVEE